MSAHGFRFTNVRSPGIPRQTGRESRESKLIASMGRTSMLHGPPARQRAGLRSTARSGAARRRRSGRGRSHCLLTPPRLASLLRTPVLSPAPPRPAMRVAAPRQSSRRSRAPGGLRSDVAPLSWHSTLLCPAAPPPRLKPGVQARRLAARYRRCFRGGRGVPQDQGPCRTDPHPRRGRRRRGRGARRRQPRVYKEGAADRGAVLLPTSAAPSVPPGRRRPALPRASPRSPWPVQLCVFRGLPTSQSGLSVRLAEDFASHRPSQLHAQGERKP